MSKIVDVLWELKALSYFEEEVRAIIIVLGFYMLLTVSATTFLLNIDGPIF